MSSTRTLEERLRPVAQELTFRPSAELMEQVNSWAQLLRDIEAEFGSLEAFYGQLPGDLESTLVDFPSENQLNTIATILEKRRLIIGDEPGTQKTAPAALAKQAAEQLLLNGQKLKALVVCPGYVISHWTKKLEEYLESVKTVVITSENKGAALKFAADPDVDYVLISYDMIFRSLGIDGDPDSVEEIERRRQELVELPREQLIELSRQNLPKRRFERLSGAPVPVLAQKLAEYQVRAEAEALVDELGKVFGSNGRPYYVILDEFHNAKNPESLRSRAVKRIAVGADFLALLSGTKTPDNLNDIANAASILNPKSYPTAASFIKAYSGKPELVRMFYHVWEKKPVLRSEDLGDMPELKQMQEIGYELSEFENAVYRRILEFSELLPQEKLILLRRALVDPKLVDPKNYQGSQRLQKKLEECFADSPGFDEAESTRYRVLDELVGRIVGQGDKVIVYTKFTTGITGELERRLMEAGYGICRVDDSVSLKSTDIRLSEHEADQLKASGLWRGQRTRTDLSKKERALLDLQHRPLVALSERDKQVLEFQTNPDKQIMVTTFGTLREGRDLTAANHVVFLDRDYSPGIEKQCIKRAHRSGQRKPVFQYYIHAIGTVDEGIKEHITKKAAVIEAAEAGRRLTAEEFQMFKNGVAPTKQPEISRWLVSSDQLVRTMSGMMVGKGVDFVTRFLDTGNNAKLYADSYNFEWEFSYSAQTARLLEQVADKLVEQGSLERILDLGCGPAVFSRQTKRPATCVDINKHQLENGRKICEGLGIQNEYFVAAMNRLSFANDGSFDLAVCSLALHYGKVDDGEREQVIREMNRVLRPDGYMLLALPKNIVNDEGKAKLESGLADLGIEVDRTLTGTYVATKAVSRTGQVKRSSYEVYLVVGKRVGSPSNCAPDTFVLNTEYDYSVPKKKTAVAMCQAVPVAGEVCTEFLNIDTQVKLINYHPAQEVIGIVKGMLNGKGYERSSVMGAFEKLSKVLEEDGKQSH